MELLNAWAVRPAGIKAIQFTVRGDSGQPGLVAGLGPATATVASPQHKFTHSSLRVLNGGLGSLGMVCLTPRTQHGFPRSTAGVGLCQLSHSPGMGVLLANAFTGVTIALDRIIVGATFPIRDFAIYAFAANALAVVNTIILSVSRVVFPYLSDGVSLETRVRAYWWARRASLDCRRLAWPAISHALADHAASAQLSQ